MSSQMIRRLNLHSVFAVALVLAACGVAPDEPLGLGAIASPILAGATDTQDTAVVAIDTLLPTGEELCTGFAVMPDLVVTAQHCAAAMLNATSGCAATFGAPLDPSKITVSTESSVVSTFTPLSVAEVFVVPGSTGQSPCGNDLALLRLSSPLQGINVLAMRLDTPPAVAEPFTAVGYGTSSTTTDTSGERRFRSLLSVSSVGVSARTTAGEWIADQGPCAGDSGGPALDGQWQAIGVMSRGSKSTCQAMIYERVDLHADWLRAAVTASASRLGIAIPGWAGGGTVDAGGGTVDAGGGTVDAGGGAPDAGGGAPDAGGGTPDAGGGTPDAGDVPDAGNPTTTRGGGCTTAGRGDGRGGYFAFAFALVLAISRSSRRVSAAGRARPNC